jgi:hypothetical protein
MEAPEVLWCGQAIAGIERTVPDDSNPRPEFRRSATAFWRGTDTFFAAAREAGALA